MLNHRAGSHPPAFFSTWRMELIVDIVKCLIFLGLLAIVLAVLGRRK